MHGILYIEQKILVSYRLKLYWATHLIGHELTAAYHLDHGMTRLGEKGDVTPEVAREILTRAL